MLDGEESLSAYIRYKNSLWAAVRKSYRQLQLHQIELEEFLSKPVNPSMSQKADDIFRTIVYHWSAIDTVKCVFEGTLLKYKRTTPSDLEMALYREYSLHGNRIKESCKANLAKAGFTYPISQRMNTDFK